MTTEQLEAEILKLPERDRARLAQRLLASLDADHEREEKWYDEAERRLAQLDSGDAAEIPAEEVFEALGIASAT